jgi:hypothetical protein
MKKVIFFLLTALSCIFQGSVHASTFLESTPSYLFTASLDNLSNAKQPFFSSRQSSTELIASSAYSIGWLQDHFGLGQKYPTLTYVGNMLLTRSLISLQREWTGRGLQAQAFNTPMQTLVISPLPPFLEFISWLASPNLTNQFMLKLPNKAGNPVVRLSLQEQSMMPVLSVQASSLLAQTLLEQHLETNQVYMPDFIVDFYRAALFERRGYIGKFFMIRWLQKRLGRDQSIDEKNDVVTYIKLMELLYGKDSVTLKHITWLSSVELLNIHITHLLSKHMQSPWIEEVGGIPALRILPPLFNLVLTPYNVLEKRFTLYGKLASKTFKIVFGIGKEQKSDIPVNLDNEPEWVHQWLEGMSPSDWFSSPSNASKSYSFYTGLSIYKAYSLGPWSFGMDIAAWRQPKLFDKSQSARMAPMQLGGLVLLRSTCRLNPNVNAILNIGYKTEGFMLEYTTKSTVIVQGKLNWMYGAS